MIYKGYRNRNGKCVVTVDGRPLPVRLDLVNHSPTGFEWGYGGSGPAQLALAILAHHTRDNSIAIEFHQAFKDDVISKFRHDNWELLSSFVESWLERPLGVTLR